VLGQDRRQEVDKGKPLAGKSTLNRLELGAQRQPPFPRPTVRPKRCFNGCPPKANS
jgi:hypothetical protein